MTTAVSSDATQRGSTIAGWPGNATAVATSTTGLTAGAASMKVSAAAPAAPSPNSRRATGTDPHSQPGSAAPPPRPRGSPTPVRRGSQRASRSGDTNAAISPLTTTPTTRNGTAWTNTPQNTVPAVLRSGLRTPTRAARRRTAPPPRCRPPERASNPPATAAGRSSPSHRASGAAARDGDACRRVARGSPCPPDANLTAINYFLSETVLISISVSGGHRHGCSCPSPDRHRRHRGSRHVGSGARRMRHQREQGCSVDHLGSDDDSCARGDRCGALDARRRPRAAQTA